MKATIKIRWEGNEGKPLYISGQGDGRPNFVAVEDLIKSLAGLAPEHWQLVEASINSDIDPGYSVTYRTNELNMRLTFTCNTDVHLLSMVREIVYENSKLF